MITPHATTLKIRLDHTDKLVNINQKPHNSKTKLDKINGS